MSSDMTDIQIVASLETLFEEWWEANADSMPCDPAWVPAAMSGYMAIAAAQMLWAVRDSAAENEFEGTQA